MKAAVLIGAILACALGAAIGELNVRPQRIAVNPPKSRAASGSTTNVVDGRWHSVIRRPSPTLPRIHWYNKFNPIWWFKNADEPKPPEWFKPGKKHRQFSWWLRNPMHNFTHYVIGIADKKFVRSGRYPEKVSNPKGGWNFAISRRGIFFLPYLSYRRGKFEFYFGWRVRGNFGAKLNWNAERTHPLPGDKEKDEATEPKESRNRDADIRKQRTENKAVHRKNRRARESANRSRDSKRQEEVEF